MPLYSGDSFFHVMGKWMASLGYAVPSNHWIAHDPVFMREWVRFCVHNGLNSFKYRTPTLEALNRRLRAAFSVFLVNETNYLEMRKRATAWSNRKVRSELHTRMTRLAARNTFINNIEYSLQLARNKHGIVPLSILRQFMGEDREQLIRSAQMATVKAWPALGGDTISALGQPITKTLNLPPGLKSLQTPDTSNAFSKPTFS